MVWFLTPSQFHLQVEVFLEPAWWRYHPLPTPLLHPTIASGPLHRWSHCWLRAPGREHGSRFTDMLLGNPTVGNCFKDMLLGGNPIELFQRYVELKSNRLGLSAKKCCQRILQWETVSKICWIEIQQWDHRQRDVVRDSYSGKLFQIFNVGDSNKGDPLQRDVAGRSNSGEQWQSYMCMNILWLFVDIRYMYTFKYTYSYFMEYVYIYMYIYININVYVFIYIYICM